jgi:hypothetical protein
LYPVSINIDTTASASNFIQPMGFPYFEQSQSWHSEFQEAYV